MYELRFYRVVFTAQEIATADCSRLRNDMHARTESRGAELDLVMPAGLQDGILENIQGHAVVGGLVG